MGSGKVRSLRVQPCRGPRRHALEVRANPPDALGLLDAGDDPEPPAAASARVDLEAGHAL
jgi:hypothetical protein